SAASVLLVHRALLKSPEPKPSKGHWYPVSLIVSDVALYSLLLLTLFYIFLFFNPQGFGLKEGSLELIKEMGKEAGTNQKVIAFYTTFIYKFLPSILALNTFIVTLGAGFFSQKILQRSQMTLR